MSAMQPPVQNVDHKMQMMKDALAALQIQVARKHDDSATEVTRKLRPLAEEIYNEVMLERYKRPTFSKYNGESNPWDHVTLFEIECGSIRQNDNLKFERFPSTFIGQAMRWFNNWPPNSISSWDDFVEQFTSHF